MAKKKKKTSRMSSFVKTEEGEEMLKKVGRNIV